MSVERGDELVSALLTAAADDPLIGEASYELLNLFLAGEHPVDRLRPLLQEQHDAAVRVGSWIASELPAPLARQVLEDIPRLLENEDPQVRFFAVETVLTAATAGDGQVIAAALGRVYDEHSGVRIAVTKLMAWLQADGLVSARDELQDSRLKDEVSWLATEGSDPSARSAIQERLSAVRPESRLVAVAAATRIAGVDDSALRTAEQSTDGDVAGFAGEQAKHRLWTRLGGRWRTWPDVTRQPARTRRRHEGG